MQAGYRQMVAAVLAMAYLHSASAGLTNRYVMKGNVSAAPPYDTPANAAADIQTAIDYAYTANGSTVLVAAATYDVGGTLVFSCTNRVYISKAVTVRSVNNDPENTIIRGAWHPATTNGPAAVRCVYMVAGASLIGFTLTNGATANTFTSGFGYQSMCGGGVYAASATCTISNCVIAGNASHGDAGNGVGGGGAHVYATFYNCIFSGNWSAYGGGGAWNCVLSNCTLTGNSTPGNGGGARNGTLYGCVVSNNVANYGGGVAGSSASSQVRVYDSIIVGNRAARGGGTYGGILDNCLILRNTAPGASGYGGGAYCDGVFACDLRNCTIVSNSSPNGGGIYRTFTTNCVIAYNNDFGGYRVQTLRNCLVYGNQYAGIYNDTAWHDLIVESSTIVGNHTRGLYMDVGKAVIHNSIIYDNQNQNNWQKGGTGTIVFTNTCTRPEQVGWHASNITNDPLFVLNGIGYGTNCIAGNYRLSSRSPCINTGLNQTWMTGALDRDGLRRIDQGSLLVDMGCYEYVFPGGTLIQLR